MQNYYDAFLFGSYHFSFPSCNIQYWLIRQWILDIDNTEAKLANIQWGE